MKKVLSIVLAVMLALTAMVGCFTVSADGAATATVDTVTIDAGTAEAVVNITIAGDAIAATYIDVALPELALTGVESLVDGLAVGHNSVNADGYEDFTVADAANSIRLLLDSAEGIVDYTELKVALTFATADAAVGTYAVTVTGSDAANSDETAVVIEPVAGAVVVNEVVTCEHDWEVAEAVAATTEADGSLDLVCSICGAEDNDNVVKYIRYARANNRALILEAEISIGAQVYDRDLVRCNEAASDGVYTNYFVQFTEARPEGEVVSYSYKDEATLMGATSDRPYYLFTYGLRSIDMVNDVTMTVFAEVDGQWVTGEVYTDSVQSVSDSLLATASTPAATKTLVVDMLNYGAAAQVNFGVNTENLPSAVGYEDLGSTGDVSYTDNSSWASSSSEAAPFTTTGISLELNSKILLQPALQFGNKYYANYTDKYDGMKIVVSYTNFKGVEIEQEYVNVTVDPDGEYVFASTDGVRKFNMSIDLFTPADLRETFTIKAYTADGVQLNEDIISSVESSAYLIRESAVASGNTNLVNLLDAMMRYGDAANVAFS